MVDVYVALIINGRRTFAQVPVSLQPAVEAELAALGLGTDGKPLETAS
ncbi:CD1375 family protein [Paenibacillus thermotolerans]|nr:MULTISPECIES: CD1375 family protein [unclassified Paenibacillus]